ncbi:MAG TPA: hypothetical protein VK453_25760 [Micromonosporaceae bacterium]|nr:hypothetical protein [Micromonosporaceae bacterium]
MQPPTDTAEIVGRVANIIESRRQMPYRAGDLAYGAAKDLLRAGLLAGSTPTTSLPVREAAINILQCRMPAPDAEAIATECEQAGLLAARA